MKHLEILVGVSGAGKSTYAHKLWKKDPLNTIVVSRDKTRELLFGYNENDVQDYHNSHNFQELEMVVTEHVNSIIIKNIHKNKYVILDATNLRMLFLTEILNYFEDLCNISLTYFDISVEDAFKNIQNRTRKVSKELIERQMKEYNKIRYTNMGVPFQVVTFSPIVNISNNI